MKRWNKRRILKWGLIVAILYILGFTNLINNFAFYIMDPEYIVPKESSFISFRVTIMNPGSGDWWIYGEDKKNYYYYYGLGNYAAISRENTCPNFKKLDYRTWCGVDILPHNGYPNEISDKYKGELVED
ncbi:hypothetical protein [Desulfovibrio litoralis]|uniref:DUF943 family protein n=1 Tax=Desulfovibrio litoralis DSM 11393 TaxID=1121455 RepID=A0A1M7SGK1_9BACT|nr:hypothetical protein [Desulfovibrio litoralis]SHN57606.1 hypothetical protein SAMN02745728_00925 [Desulfovibrio litoralis DSM 11393]